jgi:peptide/nickel transport system permease protein
MISRLIEIKVAIPTMLLILSIVAVMKSPSVLLVMVIIGLTSWTGIAKYTRAELLKVRSLEYIDAAQALGYSRIRTIFRHALPNSLSAVLVAVAFGIAGAILLESSLSFLGIGVRPEDVTWGSMITGARGYFKAWWLAIFPGLAIFLTVTIFNLLGEGLTDAMDPRLKQ